MGHGHHHHGESVSGYFTEQLLTILVCLLFGFAAIQMYRTNMLGFLAPDFREPVLYGGIGIVVLVVLRGIAVWKEAGELQAQAMAAGTPTCGLDHTHGPDCDHDPNIGHTHDHDHDHSHSHDMSWMFARMLILVFPVGLFFLGLPNASFSKERQLAMAGGGQAIGAEKLKEMANDPTTKVIEGPPLSDQTPSDKPVVRVLQTPSGLKIRSTTPAGGGEPKLELIAGAGVEMSFNDLNDAAFDEGKRRSLQGETAILEGRFKRIADKEFTLFRLKMTCCAADTVPLKVRIVVPQAMNALNDFDWVQVKGQIQFFKVTNPKDQSETYIPVIMVADITDVKKTPPKNEYE
jgi:hypothetical protein